MTKNRRFCYTLDVLTDGSEHTGCGTLFLSVWKIPLSIGRIATGDNNDNDDNDDESYDGDSDSSRLSNGEESEEEKHAHEPKETNDDPNHDCDGIRNERDSDPYSWLTGASEGVDDESSSATANAPSTDPHHTPVARYAISGFGDATARLCADQQFKLAPTRACFVPEMGTLAEASDGLSALFLALYGAGAPSLNLVVPSLPQKTDTHEEDDGDGFVESLASIVLGAYKNLDIRTCEVREAEENKDKNNSLIWWKVYEDNHLIVHAASSRKFLLASEGRCHGKQQLEERSFSVSLIFLYSFPIGQLGIKNGTAEINPYCTLALLPPKCRNLIGVYERLVRQNLPVIRDGVPMNSIDYVLFLDPNQSFPSSPDFSFNPEGKNETNFAWLSKKSSRILMTLPRNKDHLQKKEFHSDEGILIRSQQLHRYFHRSMPWAFAPPPSLALSLHCCATTTRRKEEERILILKSGTSIVLEKNRDNQSQHQVPKTRIWDRRKSIWKKELKEEWTKPTLESLQSFVRKSPSIPSQTPTAITDENEIELDDDTDTDAEEESKNIMLTTVEDENEIDLDDEEESVVEDEEIKGGTTSSSTSSCQEGVLGQGEKNVATYGHGPRLLVLGTGCATPSAYRGASGYALVLPTSESAREVLRTNHQYCFSNFGVGLGGHHQNATVKNHACEEDGDQIFLLDCGEGVSTMLSRNCDHINDWKRRVRGIWISHSHLDHYGGLPTLLRLLCKERESLCSGTNVKKNTDAQSRKRPRHAFSSASSPPFGSSNNVTRNTCMPVPWVVAPSKVLQYLDLVLDCNHGRSKNGKMVCFEPRLHHDPRLPLGNSSPFFHFENLRVHHNCCPAFGLLLGWKRRARDTSCSGRDSSDSVSREHRTVWSENKQFLCYSGDTRPSQSLVRACKRVLLREQCHPRGFDSSRSYARINEETKSDLFLIHEATFRNTELTMAQKKRHSTTGEALEIATAIPRCSRLLMTHFSQRYDNLTLPPEPSVFERNHSNGKSNANGDGNNNKSRQASIDSPSVGLAVDGLWIHLD